jgi:poly(A) polymerase
MEDSKPAALAARIVAALRERSHQAWLVGGCVRDRLLGLEPKDFDVATSARPEQVLALFPDAEIVGAHFGVIIVKDHGCHVEVSTFRSDSSYSDGRRPDAVTFESSPEKDALRRDFTINALFLDPFSGEVLDFVGGRADLAARLVRAVGDPPARFREDHLRMIRAIRIAACFGFTIHPTTFAAISELKSLIHNVSAERIRDELLRILTEGGARRGFEQMDAASLLQELLPEVKAFQGVEQPPDFHPEGDVWTHVMLMLGLMGFASGTLALGVLLHDIAKPPTFRIAADRIRFDGHVEQGVVMARQILGRLKCSNDATDRVTALVAHHMRFKDVRRMKPSTLKRFLSMPHFEEHLELHRLDCLSSHRNLDNYEYVLRLWRETPAEVLRPPRLITGADLIAAGLQPGEPFREILRALEDAQLDGRINTKEEALAFVETLPVVRQLRAG